MLCGLIGVAAAIVCRIILGSIKLDQFIILPAVTYLAFAIGVAALVWLLRFGH